jgi:hypothetical protein
MRTAWKNDLSDLNTSLSCDDYQPPFKVFTLLLLDVFPQCPSVLPRPIFGVAAGPKDAPLRLGRRLWPHVRRRRMPNLSLVTFCARSQRWATVTLFRCAIPVNLLEIRALDGLRLLCTDCDAFEGNADHGTRGADAKAVVIMLEFCGNLLGSSVNCCVEMDGGVAMGKRRPV